jgi:hypothetical protein
MKQMTEDFIEQSVDLENAAWLLEISDRFGAHRLKRVCMELICESNKENLVRGGAPFTLFIPCAPFLMFTNFFNRM